MSQAETQVMAKDFVTKLDELQKEYETRDAVGWFEKDPNDKMQDIQLQTDEQVGFIMDHYDDGSKITYEVWTMTNSVIKETFEYPKQMDEDSKLVQFLDLAELPRTRPTDYDDSTTVPVEYDEDDNSWNIDYSKFEPTRPDILSMGTGKIIYRALKPDWPNMSIDPFSIGMWAMLIGTLKLVISMDIWGVSLLVPVLLVGIALGSAAMYADNDSHNINWTTCVAVSFMSGFTFFDYVLGWGMVPI